MSFHQSAGDEFKVRPGFKSRIDAIRANPQSSIKSIAEQLGDFTPAQIRTQINKLQSMGFLLREGPTGHGGRWVLKQNEFIF